MNGKAESQNEDEKYLNGIAFIPARQATGRGLGANLWAAKLGQPHFIGVEAGKAYVKTLDEVEKARVYYVDEAKGEATELEEFRGIRSIKTGNTYTVRTVKYTPVQDREVASPMIAAAEELGLSIEGRVDGVGTGLSRAHITINDPDYQVKLGQGFSFQDIGNVGIEWWNSYTGEMGFGARVFIRRWVCSNHMSMGDLLGIVKGRHVGDLTGIENRFKELMLNCIKQVPKLQELIAKAQARPVMQVEMEDLLWAIDLPKTGIDDIARNPKDYTPEIGEKPSLYDTYNAVTAWVSYRNNSGKNVELTSKMSLQALDLLTKDVDKLIAKGQEKREEYIEAEKEKLARKEEKERAAAQKVLLATDDGGMHKW